MISIAVRSLHLSVVLAETNVVAATDVPFIKSAVVFRIELVRDLKGSIDARIEDPFLEGRFCPGLSVLFGCSLCPPQGSSPSSCHLRWQR